ncbi:MAG: 16S rRNA (adenine(1518)-N(6)/adenine(1519)-N(6))-dimethyltransferase RsmA [Syntrophomonas sp.]|nr:16S rRNA (adenine(1518)-N(6)/adenine(1519)-N(6))-dimethyltransferase RsmA [Syntrophomonas sp.]
MLDRATPSVTKKLMKKYNLFPKKRLGQNFLLDRNVLIKIADSCGIASHEYVVEIGPGLGGLTQELSARSRGVLAIEIDTSLEPALMELASENNNVTFLFQDVLKVNIEAELRRAFKLEQMVPYQVCANIPYNITTPIIFQLLEECPNMQAATLLMQKEVGDRILAAPGNKEYGRLTLSTAYYADVKHIMNVSRNCFYPQPEVDSSVLRLIPNKIKRYPVKNEEIFRKLLLVAFQKRRKTILNITSGFFNISKEETRNILTEIGLKEELRPENLSIEDVIRLVNAFVQ